MTIEEKDLRCFCHTHPRLATYGVNEKGQLFIHIKIYKRDKIFGNIVVVGGKVTFQCRICWRWHTIHIRQPENVAILKHERGLGDSFPIAGD